MSFLKIENLVKNFDQTKVLKGVSFELEKNEVVAILGSSGSGKTTLLRSINFLETPESGSMILNDNIIFDGAIKKENQESIRKKRLHFGLVFQSFNLFPQYTVKKNVELPVIYQYKEKLKRLKKMLRAKPAKHKNESADELNVGSDTEENIINQQTQNFINQPAQNKIDEVEQKANEFRENILAGRVTKKECINAFKAEQSAKIAELSKQLLQKVGLEEKSNNYPFELSGGQQQRVAIARALALSPDVLCFDEPTSALDPALTGEVTKVIKELKGLNMTLIIVTHEMEFAKNVADKIIFMSDGIVECEMKTKDFFENNTNEKALAFLKSPYAD